MANGYAGRFLRVDLTEGRCSPFTVENDRLRKFIGGAPRGEALPGRLPAGRRPPRPRKPADGDDGADGGERFPRDLPICGLRKVSAHGYLGESACGGTFGPELKKAGYDGIVITGRAEKPVVLSIVEGEAKLTDASGLWGRDIYETTDLLKEADKGAKTLVIGPAGENLVRFAVIGKRQGPLCRPDGPWGRHGGETAEGDLGPGEGKLAKADEARFRELHREAVQQIKDSALAGSLHAMGSDANMDLGMINGDVPVKNWSVGEDFDLSSALSGPTLSETYLTRAHACTHCPVACKRVVRVPDGPFQTEEGPGPEYETCGAFGTMIMNRDLAGVIKANELCNRLGMDTISCGAAIAWAMELFEKGTLTVKETDGLDLAWGNMGSVLALLPRIARREGFGDLLAQGEPCGRPEDRRHGRGCGRPRQGARSPDARPAGLPRDGACLHDVEPRGLPPPARRPRDGTGDGLLAAALPDEGRLQGGRRARGRRSLSSTRKTTASSAIRFRSATTSPIA